MALYSEGGYVGRNFAYEAAENVDLLYQRQEMTGSGAEMQGRIYTRKGRHDVFVVYPVPAPAISRVRSSKLLFAWRKGKVDTSNTK